MKIGDIMKLDRSDISDFPRETVDQVLALQKKGWRTRRSNKNHIVLLSPNGAVRLSASRNSASARYLAEDIRRYEEGLPPIDREKEVKVAPTPKFTCPRTNCFKSYNSLEKLNVHIGIEHEGKLACPECDELFGRAATLGTHRFRAHGYISPKRAQRKAAEARRKGEPVEGDIPSENKDEAGVIEEVDRTDDAIEYLKADAKLTAEHFGLQKGTLVNGSIDVSSNRESLDFIDERDSWTLNLRDIYDMPIGDVARVLQSAGLEVEMRTWKKD